MSTQFRFVRWDEIDPGDREFLEYGDDEQRFYEERTPKEERFPGVGGSLSRHFFLQNS